MRAGPCRRAGERAGSLGEGGAAMILRRLILVTGLLLIAYSIWVLSGAPT